MTIKEKDTSKGNQIHWLDNLRTITILLVVLYHVGGVYESAGLWGWFWIVDDPNTITWVGIIGIVFDIMVMPIMFFTSGYLTPASQKMGTDWEFVKGKFKRLIIPWAIAVFTLIPLYKVIFLYSRGLPQEHWSTYFHFTNPNSQNWLHGFPAGYPVLPTEPLFGKTQEQDLIHNCKFSCLASGHWTHLYEAVAFLLSKSSRVSDHTVVSTDLAPELLPCTALPDVCDY